MSLRAGTAASVAPAAPITPAASVSDPADVPHGPGRPLRGVVLIGGQSTRMGRPKSGIEYAPGVSATRQAVDVLSTVCDGVYLSVRPDQEVPKDVADVPRIDDCYVGIGPMGGILSALETDRRAAWLTLACDMPFLRGSDLTILVAGRDEGAIATSATVAAGGRDAAGRPGAPARRPVPEPLCTIWEPRAREALLAALDRGIASPRRVLAASPVRLVELPDPMALFNANTPDERARVATRVSGVGML